MTPSRDGLSVIRTYRYQLLPSRREEAILQGWLHLARELYNAALQERREAYQRQGISLTRFNQYGELPGVREVREEFAEVPNRMLRGAIRRLDLAYQAFFRRVKQGQRPGFPRFKGAHRFRTLEIPDLGQKNPVVAGGKRIAIPKLGKVRFRQHRPLEGTPKTIKLTLDAGGRWYVSIACQDVPRKPLPKTGASVGIDLGLTQLVATSDGESFPNPKVGRAFRLQIERASRRVSRRKKGSQRRRKAAVLLAKKHARAKNIRCQGHIDLANSLVRRYDTICHEDLSIAGLARGMLAKSVHDAGWGELLWWLTCKAESADRSVVEVDPRGTSQRCSGCGALVKKSLAVRVHRCPGCGLALDRDVNAAVNILRLGLSLQGAAPGSNRTVAICEAS